MRNYFKKELFIAVTEKYFSYLAEFILEKIYESLRIKKSSINFNKEKIDNLHQNPYLKNQKFISHYRDSKDTFNLIRIRKQLSSEESYKFGGYIKFPVFFELANYTTIIDYIRNLIIFEAKQTFAQKYKTKFYFNKQDNK